MDFKIVKVDSATTDAVLIQRRIDDETNLHYVEVSTWHTQDDQQLLQSVDVKFESDSYEIISNYIKDFSKNAAQIFADHMEF